jgi:hypothetical protein
LAEDLQACWEDAKKVSIRLDGAVLSNLLATGMVLDEQTMQRRPALGVYANTSVQADRPAFPALRVYPPSPIPELSMRRRPPVVRARRRGVPSLIDRQPSVVPSVGAVALVMQINPHRNGEVFLSKLALDQNPAFFGWPFTGQTVPKDPRNQSYPQRIPDPVVCLTVFNRHGTIAVQHSAFPLNTVYYDRNHEIRVTVSPDVVRTVPDGSIMVMSQPTEGQGLDYDIRIYVEGSPDYGLYLSACNQEMPSGGRNEGRRFGWL